MTPSLLAWAVERSRLEQAQIAAAFPRFADWLDDQARPTISELEKFAKLTRTPLGYLFLEEPPEESVPIRDFRTWGNLGVERPSPDLLDTLYDCQMRQAWYHDHALAMGFESLKFVGSVTAGTSPDAVAAAIRQALGLDSRERARWNQPANAWRWLVDAAESLGVLVMVSGVVGLNTHRKLDPGEFRGFALVDPLAPVIFVNGADSKPSKAPHVFTLIHELAHIWAGDSGVSGTDFSTRHGDADEVWANRVAAEVLVPASELTATWSDASATELQRLRKIFCVSTLAILNQALDCGLLSWDVYQRTYASEWSRVAGALQTAEATGGGNFHHTQPYRVSKRFAKALVSDTLEGRTLYTDSYALLGVRKHSVFERFAETVMA
ncbi:MAG: ImmA/IrrE family metallo-endopeptidase [Propionibacteriaceae bacterium]|nr:ImmA/IrrE family metallo-endopeptidase [Propionibacteriaceae bacterium]